MAVETVKSLVISNRDASPQVPSVAAIAGGLAKSAIGNVVVGASASAGSYYPMCSVPSNARINRVWLSCAALGAGCTMDIGVFVPTVTSPLLLALSSSYTAAAGIIDNFFGDNIDTSAALAITDETNQSTQYTIAKQGKELWDALGLASDPNCMLDIGCLCEVAAVAGGALQIRVEYVS